MFGMNFTESLFVIASMASFTIMFKCYENITNKIIENFKKQHDENVSLKKRITQLEEENKNLSEEFYYTESVKPFDENNSSINNDSDKENNIDNKDYDNIIRKLMKVNEKLQLKCDMLEQELLKTREKYLEKSNEGYMYKF